MNLIKIKSELNLIKVLEKIEKLTFYEDGSLCYMIKKEAGLVKGFEEIYDEIFKFRNQKPINLMINKLPPGITVPVHRDFLPPTRQGEHPVLERWHLVLKTNDKSFFWGETTGNRHLEYGYWWGPIPYWKNHNIYNNGEADRIHIVVDLDSPIRIGKYLD
jgi:hypothetical protein